MERRVAVVLITWNSEALLHASLTALAAQSLPPSEFVFVDNASFDSSIEVCKRFFPESTVIRNVENLGFSVAANQGIAASAAPYVLLLNPDARLHADYLAELVNALEQAGPGVGSVTGKLLRASGDALEPLTSVDSKGIEMTRTGRHLDIDAETRDCDGEAVREVFGVSGAAAMYRREFLMDASVDGQVFDENFFAYREDADLSWRGQLFGWRALYVPGAVAWHLRSVTPARRSALAPFINMHSVKNRFLLRLKNQGGYLALRNLPFELARDLIVVGAVLLRERTSLPAFLWLWQHRQTIMRQRREIQKKRRVSDFELARWFRRL